MVRLLWSQTNSYLTLTLERNPSDVQVHLCDNQKQIEFVVDNCLYKFYLKGETAEIRDFEVLNQGRFLRIRFEKYPSGFWKRHDFGWNGGAIETDWEHYEDSDEDEWKTFEIPDGIQSFTE